MEVKDRKAFIRVGISLAKKSIATASQAEGEKKKLRHHDEKGRWLHRLVRRQRLHRLLDDEQGSHGLIFHETAFLIDHQSCFREIIACEFKIETAACFR